jgi:restriction endonuclease S subunit
MSSYAISNPALNPKRVFILQKSDVEKRFDPFFYIPELLELEKKVLAKEPKKLRDYVLKVASGATPKTTETELYYSEKENGIPFLRVQNLSPTGVLEFDDCKYINEETHSGMLKRSQVSAGDLLVKITGVGRMAIASVAPEGFIGNINQHVCVIKTGNKEISETLSAFLNSDIGERLASRRSAGGTRPALDYPALLSIPIIEDKRILEITNKVILQKQTNEAEAEKLLASIDDYLLGKLGITLPTPPENTLKNRMFISNSKDILGSRFDPEYYNPSILEYVNLIKENKNSVLIKRLYSSISTGFNNETRFINEGVPFLRTQNIRPIELDINDTLFTTDENLRITEIGDLLFTRIGVGVGDVSYNSKGSFAISDNVICLKLKDIEIGKFIAIFLNTFLGKKLLNREKRDTARAIISYENILNLPIPVPPLDKQKEIADHITNIRNQAQALKDKTKDLLKKASEEIEEILLN